MGTEPGSSSSTAIRNALGELRTTTRAFFDSPRALWGLNIPYLLEGISYFGVLTLLMKLLSENLGLGDIRAGIVVSLFTGGITFAMFFLGELGDRFGTRRVLLLSITVMAVGRVLLTAAGRLPGGGLTSPAFLVTALGLLVIVVGFGTFQPALFSAVKQYSDPKTSAVAFGVIYGLNNLGAFLAGFLSPMAREASASAFPPNGIQGVYGLYALLTFVSIAVTAVLLTPKLVDGGPRPAPRERRPRGRRERRAEAPRLLREVGGRAPAPRRAGSPSSSSSSSRSRRSSPTTG